MKGHDKEKKRRLLHWCTIKKAKIYYEDPLCHTTTLEKRLKKTDGLLFRKVIGNNKFGANQTKLLKITK